MKLYIAKICSRVKNIHITIDDSVAAAVKIRFRKDTSDDGSATGDRPKIVGMPNMF